MMSRRFESYVVWITGGGSGIGRSLALEFAKEGALVAISGRRETCLNQVVKEIEALGGRGLAVPCDVTDEASVQAAVDQVLASFGTLNVCIANAGFSISGKIENLTADDWRRQFDVNVIGLTSTIRAAMPELKKSKGRIVLMASVASMIPMAGFSPYVASKQCRSWHRSNTICGDVQDRGDLHDDLPGFHRK